MCKCSKLNLNIFALSCCITVPVLLAECAPTSCECQSSSLVHEWRLIWFPLGLPVCYQNAFCVNDRDVRICFRCRITLQQDDPRWVGAWWVGYLALMVAILLIAPAFFGYPPDPSTSLYCHYCARFYRPSVCHAEVYSLYA